MLEEISMHQTCFQIMIKLLLGENMMMWMHFRDIVADIKLNLEYMKWILVEQ
jgi:hypothetical protein